MGDVSSHVYTHFEPKTMIESQKNPGKASSNVLSHKLVKRMPSHCIGNPSGSNPRMGLMITWESGFNARMGLMIAWVMFQVKSKHILNEKPRLSLKKIQEAQVGTCCRTSEPNGCVRLVFGNPKGSNARMGLVMAWKVCQVMSKHILNGKPLLNLKRIQEAQVRTCCRTCESDRCLRVVLEIRMDLMLDWDS
ncbi:uncharacterized protein G2W53_028923 [Senna tora]|uniref:Uncharacterized protein n=1 Tax=Senna tora TaxID=362788 RepID=A0A834WF89_9FABA|nr:uncharacterized protein G2W53_028923 [Senna tora]